MTLSASSFSVALSFGTVALLVLGCSGGAGGGAFDGGADTGFAGAGAAGAGGGLGGGGFGGGGLGGGGGSSGDAGGGGFGGGGSSGDAGGSQPGMDCDTMTGCAASGAQPYVCANGKCTASDGEGGDPCGSPSDCKQGQCIAGKCMGTEGATCNPGTDSCATGLCCDGYPTPVCGACGANHGEKCSPLPLPPPLGMPCKPGLLCCEHSSGAGTNYYCYPSC